jgi:hypothetical protein
MINICRILVEKYLRVRYHLGYLGVEERIMLKWILDKYTSFGGWGWNRCMGVRIEVSGDVIWHG